jgi:hypothetical protein
MEWKNGLIILIIEIVKLINTKNIMDDEIIEVTLTNK